MPPSFKVEAIDNEDIDTLVYIEFEAYRYVDDPIGIALRARDARNEAHFDRARRRYEYILQERPFTLWSKVVVTLEKPYRNRFGHWNDVLEPISDHVVERCDEDGTLEIHPNGASAAGPSSVPNGHHTNGGPNGHLNGHISGFGNGNGSFATTSSLPASNGVQHGPVNGHLNGGIDGLTNCHHHASSSAPSSSSHQVNVTFRKPHTPAPPRNSFEASIQLTYPRKYITGWMRYDWHKRGIDLDTTLEDEFHEDFGLEGVFPDENMQIVAKHYVSHYEMEHRQLMRSKPHFSLSLLVTHPFWQTLGVASRLLTTLLLFAEKHQLLTFLQATPHAESLYERHGFKPCADPHPFIAQYREGIEIHRDRIQMVREPLTPMLNLGMFGGVVVSGGRTALPLWRREKREFLPMERGSNPALAQLDSDEDEDDEGDSEED